MTARVEIETLVEAPAWAGLPEAEALARAAAMAAVEAAGAHGGEIALLLADDARIRALNRDWRGRDAATNVLSFPADPAAAPMLGDIVLAWETVIREAREEGKPPGHHFAHLVVHGTLHLLGFDHISDADAEIMENLERRALAALAIPDPYLETEPVRATG